MRSQIVQLLLPIVLVVLIAGCIQGATTSRQAGETPSDNSTNVENSTVPCLYTDGTSCDEECCLASDHCGEQNFSYAQCKLSAGRWSTERFLDADCQSPCSAIAATQQPQACQVGLLNQSRCNGSWVETAYQEDDCSLTWWTDRYCSYGCENGTCKLEPPAPSTPVCNESFLSEYRCSLWVGYTNYLEQKYQKKDCTTTWQLDTYCEYGCSNNQCLPAPTQNRTVSNVSTIQISNETPSANLTVHFIDVGQGDAILVERSDKFILVDCGQSSTTVVNYLKNQDVSELEYLIATHPHADHIGGCDDVLENFNVLHMWDNGQMYNTQAYQNYIALAKKTNYSVAYRGDEIGFDGVDIKVLSPPQGLLSSDVNENSVVIRLSLGDIDFLLTGDCASACEQSMLSAGISLGSEILKVGHHGSNYATTGDFLEAVNPDVAIISVGANNQYRHPAQTVLDKLSSANIEMHRTDVEGNIIVTTDGETFIVK